VREFALEQLAAAGEEAAVRDRHARFYAAWASGLIDRADIPAVALLHGDLHNLSAAFAWSRARSELRTTAIELAIALIAAGSVLGYFWDQPDDGEDAFGWLSAAWEDSALSISVRYRITDALSNWAADHGMADAERWSERMLAIARAQRDPAMEFCALIRSATTALTAVGRADRAVAFSREAVALADSSGNSHWRAFAVSALGWHLLACGDYDGAITAFQEMLDFWRGQGVNWEVTGGVARSLLHLGRAWQMKGDFERATALLAESAARYLAAGDVHGAAWSHTFRGFIRLDVSDAAGALAHFGEALRLFPRAKDSWVGIAEALAGLAMVAWNGGEHERAALLAGAASGERRLARGYSPAMNERYELDRILAEAQSWLRDPALTAAWAEGEALSPDHAIERALRGSTN
jgi:tetratricopeptide (TPR) repeat protein